MPCKNPHKDLSLLPQPHLGDKNLRAMLKINKTYRLKIEKDNEIHTPESDSAGERQCHK
jgi:hypothetical protein